MANSRGKGSKKVVSGKEKQLRLVSPWGEAIIHVEVAITPMQTSMSHVMAAGIQLLHRFLAQHVKKLGDIVEKRTNIGGFVKYVFKLCYPRGLSRDSYILSVIILRLLERDYTDNSSRPRDLKAYYIF